MRQLVLDGAKWAVAEDVYEAFFQAVGAPSWHGTISMLSAIAFLAVGSTKSSFPT